MKHFPVTVPRGSRFLPSSPRSRERGLSRKQGLLVAFFEWHIPETRFCRGRSEVKRAWKVVVTSSFSPRVAWVAMETSYNAKLGQCISIMEHGG